MCSGEKYANAVTKMSILKGPYLQSEGMAGYIETEVEFHIGSLAAFTELWVSWYNLPSPRRNELYALAKGKYCYK